MDTQQSLPLEKLGSLRPVPSQSPVVLNPRYRGECTLVSCSLGMTLHVLGLGRAPFGAGPLRTTLASSPPPLPASPAPTPLTHRALGRAGGASLLQGAQEEEEAEPTLWVPGVLGELGQLPGSPVWVCRWLLGKAWPPGTGRWRLVQGGEKHVSGEVLGSVFECLWVC